MVAPLMEDRDATGICADVRPEVCKPRMTSHEDRCARTLPGIRTLNLLLLRQPPLPLG